MTTDQALSQHQAWVTAHRIWGLMSPEHQKALLSHGELHQFNQGSEAFPAGTWGEQLHIILSGDAGLKDTSRNQTHPLRTGEHFGVGVTKLELVQNTQVIAITDLMLISIEVSVLHEFLENEPALAPFFPLPLKQPPRQSNTHTHHESDMFNVSLGDVINPPITIGLNATAQEAAQLMRQHGVSSVMLIDCGALTGVVTDRDLRNRVVAEGLPLTTPLHQIATRNLLTLKTDAPAFEAMLLMARHNIHHVPVMQGTAIAGVVTASDLNRQNDLSAVYMTRDIHDQKHLEGLIKISHKLRLLQQHLAASHASAYTTGHVITTLTDAFTTRLIQLAEKEFGPPPVSYLWVAAGSQARNEQTAKSDQDNCMILDDSYDEAAHGAYFTAMTKSVCDGLDACGYVHCPGEMMAMTDKWRQTLSVWRNYFWDWVHKPEPMSLMLSSVFFDMRPVYGTTELMDALRVEMLNNTKGNTLFLGHMVSNAQKLRPPLGLFGGISLIRRGEHAGTVDLKHNGLAPIVDLARIYALAGGLSEVNTHDRLEKAASSGEVSEQSARDLRDALEFLSTLRIQHQTDRMLAGLEANNYLALHELSNFERSHLKDAFGVIQSLQTVLGQRYHF